MKQPIACAVLVCIAALAATPLQAAGDDHVPRHGGIVVEAKGVDLELVATPALIRMHPSDHGKPIKLASGSARLSLLNGSEKSEATLALAADALEAKGSFRVAQGTKIVALVTLNGKPPVTARFELK